MATTIFRSIMQECYFNGWKVEIFSFAKPNEEITLTIEEAWDDILNNGLAHQFKKLKVSVRKDKDVSNPMELRTNTTLVANNLLQWDT